MEHKAASNATRDALLGFLKPAVRESRIRNQYVQEHHALAI
jgi:rhamnosyltransferase subunit A